MSLCEAIFKINFIKAFDNALIEINNLFYKAQDLVSTMLSGASEIYSIFNSTLGHTSSLVHKTILKDLLYLNLLLKGIQCYFGA